jgi:uncharacterized membrane protein HdeD (DUF308 family)
VSAVFTITLLFSIALIFLGIERITVGITSSGGSKGSRIGNIVLGVITIAISGLPMAFPLFAFEIIVFLISFGLLFTGIRRIMQGISSKTSDRWYRATLIGFGIFAIVFSVLVLLYPILTNYNNNAIRCISDFRNRMYNSRHDWPENYEFREYEKFIEVVIYEFLCIYCVWCSILVISYILIGSDSCKVNFHYKPHVFCRIYYTCIYI